MSIRGNSVLRAADRLAGPMMLRGLGLLLPRRRQPAAPRRIGLLKTAAIGDTLLLAGPLADLRNAFVEAEVVLVTGHDNGEAGQLVSRGLARHLTLPIHSPLASVFRLRRERFDILIDAGSWPRLDALLTALSGASYRVGFRTPGQRRHYAFDCVVDHSDRIHELENFRALLGAIGVSCTAEPRLDLKLDPSTTSPSNLPEVPYIVFHPWAGGFRGSLRQWPMDRWRQLAAMLASEKRAIVVTGPVTNRAEATELVADLNAQGARAILLDPLPLDKLSIVLCGSSALISVNTGVMHLGAILGVPTVGLHGPTSVRRWGPIGPRAAAIASTVPGCGFLNLGWEYSGQPQDCMHGVAVSAVADAVRRVQLDSPQHPTYGGLAR